MLSKALEDYDNKKTAARATSPAAPVVVKQKTIRPWFGIPLRMKFAMAGAAAIAFTAGPLAGWYLADLRFGATPKGHAIEKLVKAADQCGSVNDNARERLRSILMSSFSNSVEILYQQGVRICLDPAMPGSSPRVARYFKDTRTLVMRDNGQTLSRIAQIFKPFPDRRLPEAINRLPDALDSIVGSVLQARAIGDAHDGSAIWRVDHTPAPKFQATIN